MGLVLLCVELLVAMGARCRRDPCRASKELVLEDGGRAVGCGCGLEAFAGADEAWKG